MSKGKKKKEEAAPVEGVYQEATAIAADFLRSGESEQNIALLIQERFPILTEANVQLVIHKGSQKIADQYVRDRKNVVALHTRRYNLEIKKLMEKRYDDLIGDIEEGGMKAAEARKLRIECLLMALDVMLAKEKVLSLHTKETQVKIYNKLNAKVTEKKVMFNLADLSLQEKIEFLALISKAKKNQSELFSIKMSDQQQVQKTEDVQFEIVEGTNIDQIKKVNEHPQLPPPKEKKGLDTVTDKLKKALEKKALKEIESKGGNKGGPHIIDYTDVQH